MINKTVQNVQLSSPLDYFFSKIIGLKLNSITVIYQQFSKKLFFCPGQLDSLDNSASLIKSSVINDRKLVVIETTVKRLNTQQSLTYLKERGFTISERTLRHDKKTIKTKSLQILYTIDKPSFADQHMTRIDKLVMIEKKCGKTMKI